MPVALWRAIDNDTPGWSQNKPLSCIEKLLARIDDEMARKPDAWPLVRVRRTLYTAMRVAGMCEREDLIVPLCKHAVTHCDDEHCINWMVRLMITCSRMGYGGVVLRMYVGLDCAPLHTSCTCCETCRHPDATVLQVAVSRLSINKRGSRARLRDLLWLLVWNYDTLVEWFEMLDAMRRSELNVLSNMRALESNLSVLLNADTGVGDMETALEAEMDVVCSTCETLHDEEDELLLRVLGVVYDDTLLYKRLMCNVFRRYLYRGS